MKKTTHKVSLLKACNGLLSGALALLGYTSCDSLGIGGETPLEYGTPYAKYEIKGKVTGYEGCYRRRPRHRETYAMEVGRDIPSAGF